MKMRYYHKFKLYRKCYHCGKVYADDENENCDPYCSIECIIEEGEDPVKIIAKNKRKTIIQSIIIIILFLSCFILSYFS